MKKFIGTIIALFAMTTLAHAGNLGSISFGSVDKDGYVVSLCVDDIVFLEGDPGLGAYKAADEKWVLKNDQDQLKGATIYVLGTQWLWKGGKKASDVDVTKALGSAKLSSQTVAIHLRHSVAEENYYAVLIFMVETANGKRGWFVPFASEQFIARNKLGEAQTLAVVSKEKAKVFAPDKKGKDMAAQRE